MYISDDERQILKNAYESVEKIYLNIDYNHKEYPSLTTALDSLNTAIHKNCDD
jgi:hypothetical protein